MTHLTPDELIDSVEGAPPEAARRHLAGCADCRQQLEELRQVLGELADVPVPEPSAAEWAKLSAGVHDAVAAETGRRGRSQWIGSSWQLAVAAAAVLLLIALLPGVDRSAPGAPGSSLAGPVETQRAASLQPAPESLDAADDPSLGLMFELAGIIDLDDPDPTLDLAARAGAIDQAVDELSADERHELARLLKDAMSRPGA